MVKVKGKRSEGKWSDNEEVSKGEIQNLLQKTENLYIPEVLYTPLSKWNM